MTDEGDVVIVLPLCVMLTTICLPSAGLNVTFPWRLSVELFSATEIYTVASPLPEEGDTVNQETLDSAVQSSDVVTSRYIDFAAARTFRSSLLILKYLPSCDTFTSLLYPLALM